MTWRDLGIGQPAAVASGPPVQTFVSGVVQDVLEYRFWICKANAAGTRRGDWRCVATADSKRECESVGRERLEFQEGRCCCLPRNKHPADCLESWETYRRFIAFNPDRS